MLVIGLTGGIGSGKSTVARLFAELGVPVIDADAIARELVQPGMPALQKIKQAFGADVIGPDDTLDRQRLREIIFDDPAARQRLEGILHPLIRAEMRNRLEKVSAPYSILVIPLLVETGRTEMVDRILVVDCPEEIQIQRIKSRDDVPETHIKAIMQSQATRRQRLEKADDILINDSSRDTVRQHVAALHRKYRELAGESPRP